MKKVVFYVHEESNRIVSRVCEGCWEIKLTEDFPLFDGTKRNLSSDCEKCLGGKE